MTTSVRRIIALLLLFCAILAGAPESGTPDTHRILIRKAERKLYLYAGEKFVRAYRIGLGTNPVGPKERAGDRKTPEGDYYVCVKNPRSAFYLSLGISYPNVQDAERGMKQGLISRPQYDSIARAIRRRSTPPWKTRLGGEIFIHGNGASSDWTWGCAALDDADMRELYETVSLGTPVRIEP